MLRFAADENCDIVRGLLRRNPKLDIIRIQDVGLSGADDPSVLQWAADQGRVVITHDISTLAKHALDRVVAGQPMPGVFEVRSIAPIGQTIDDLILLAECSIEGEWLALLGRGLEDRPTSHMITLVASGVVLFVGVAWWNAHTARKLQNDIDALDAS